MTVRDSGGDERIRFVDLPAAFAEIREGLDGLWAIMRRDCAFVGGPVLASFEADFARFCQAPFAVGTASGTEALRLALLVTGVGPGDEVVTAANTYFATAAAISAVGARPVFVDPEPRTLLVSPEAMDAVAGSGTRALLPVHLYGGLCDVNGVGGLARRRGWAVVEDACQAHGARRDGAVAGSSGNLVCFSFYPGKNLGGVGEGGAVVGADETRARRLRRLRAHGQETKNHHVEISLNGHLDALSAGVLALRLPLLDAWNARRRRRAARYDEAFDAMGISRLVVPAGVESVRHLYPIAVARPDAVRHELAAAGIETGRHYPCPVPLQPAYAFLGVRREDFPVATAHAEGHVTLPMHPHLTETQVDRVVETVADLRRRRPELFHDGDPGWGSLHQEGGS